MMDPTPIDPGYPSPSGPPPKALKVIAFILSALIVGVLAGAILRAVAALPQAVAALPQSCS